MPNKFFGSKLNSVLLLVLIILMVFALRIMLKDKETYLPNLNNSIELNEESSQSNTNFSKEDSIKDVNDVQVNTSPSEVSMEAESEWASSGPNGMPPGWVTWEDTIKGVKVLKKGPSISTESYVVSGPVPLFVDIKNKRCIGDTEQTMCAVGGNSEVIRYFNLINYYY